MTDEYRRCLLVLSIPEFAVSKEYFHRGLADIVTEIPIDDAIPTGRQHVQLRVRHLCRRSNAERRRQEQM
jgi:hypothetical protein